MEFCWRTTHPPGTALCHELVSRRAMISRVGSFAFIDVLEFPGLRTSTREASRYIVCNSKQSDFLSLLITQVLSLLCKCCHSTSLRRNCVRQRIRKFSFLLLHSCTSCPGPSPVIACNLCAMYLELCRSKSTGGDELKYETKDGLAAGYKGTTSLIWPLESLGQQTNQIVTLDTSDGQAMYRSYDPALIWSPSQRYQSTNIPYISYHHLRRNAPQPPH